MKNINANQNHQAIQLSSPGVEILICRRVVLDHWEVTPTSLRPYWRLYRPWNDAGSLSYRDGELPMRAGEVWLIAPETVFRVAQTGLWITFICTFG